MHVVPGRLSTEVDDLVIEGPTYRLRAPRARLVLAPGVLWGQALSFRVVEMDQPILEMWRGRPASRPRPLNKPIVISDLRVTGAPSLLPYQLAPGHVRHPRHRLDGAIGEGTVALGATGGTWRRDPRSPSAAEPRPPRISSGLDITIDSGEAAVPRTPRSRSPDPWAARATCIPTSPSTPTSRSTTSPRSARRR